MTDPNGPRRRWAVPALIAVLAATIVVVVIIGVVAAVTQPQHTAAAPASSSATRTQPASSGTGTVAMPKGQPTVAPAPAATPHPTRTAELASPTSIVAALTAKVTKMEAITGQANGPGEIGGPSVRFTITISNSTGKSVNLSDTVVNAYYGKNATPAVELRKPGGADFPSSVKSGSSATGVFVFNIPPTGRSFVEVTVDTSVKNPVIAFDGTAPR